MLLCALQRAALDAKREVAEEERLSLESVRQQLCGKLCTYDHSGQLLLVTPVLPHKLPGPMTPSVGPHENVDATRRKLVSASPLGAPPEAAVSGLGALLLGLCVCVLIILCDLVPKSRNIMPLLK